MKSPSSTKLFAFMNPNSLKAENKSVKCAKNAFKNWPLGHGAYRISGNFGALVPRVADAWNNGFDDVLWLLDDYIKELTVLNFFALVQTRYNELQL